ncbi:amidohydrolase [uncultured Dysosmobacter sp.]|uniref:amidohydrolase family protein n=1 Tax=uncultured Dysosmobacter sp. TaxID=2591384 RepID=UPI00260B4FF4|nr:amidohydrolase [uncultured Dysosmobacter sp.]
MKKNTYMVENGVILTMDAEKHVYSDKALILKDGRIADICDVETAKDCYPDAIPVNADGMVVMPGLVNTHLHSCLVRGFGDDMKLYDWHEAIAETVSRHMTEEQAYTGALLTYLECLKSGTTTFLGLEKYCWKCYDAAVDSGIRARIVPYILDFDDCEDTVELNIEYVEKTKGPDERVKFWFGFDSFREAGDALIARIVKLSNQYHIGMQTHSNESVDDVKRCEEMHGMTPIEYLHKMGVLTNRTVLAHCVHLSEKERQLMVQTDCRVAHCCVSNMKLCDGAAPIVDYKKRGIKMGLGTDGANSNNNYDLFEEMKTAILQQRIVNDSADCMKAEDALYMATLGGADVLGLADEIGSLEVGKRADVILVNMKSLHSLPIVGKIPSILESNLVYACNGSDVDTVFVDGDMVMQGRKLLKVDEAVLIEQANKEACKLVSLLRDSGVKM